MGRGAGRRPHASDRQRAGPARRVSDEEGARGVRASGSVNRDGHDRVLRRHRGSPSDERAADGREPVRDRFQGVDRRTGPAPEIGPGRLGQHRRGDRGVGTSRGAGPQVLLPADRDASPQGPLPAGEGHEEQGRDDHGATPRPQGRARRQPRPEIETRVDLRRRYADAGQQAGDDTGLRPSTFPEEPPFGIDEVESDLWLPVSIERLRSV